MKLSERQAINYIECSRELSELSSLLLQQATDENKRLGEKIEAQSAESLYWLWLLISEYFSEEKIKKHLDKHEK